MRTQHHFSARWLALLLVALFSASLLAAVPAQAAALAPRSPHAAADTVTLTMDNAGTNFTYAGSPVPTFTAVVTFGTKPTANYFWGLSGKLDSGQAFGSNSPTTSPDGMTMTFAHMPVSAPIPTGQHTAIATFFDPGTNTTATSNSVSLTVNKAAASLTCSIDGNGFHFEGAGQTLHIRMAPTALTAQQVPVDWQDGTYTVTFDGPTHLSYPNLAPDSNDEVTVTAPSHIGQYQLVCAFSGTALFTPTDSPADTYTFSAQNPLGSVQLFTNPTTLVANQKQDYYFVFHAAPGLPAPTGQFSIYIGPNYYTEPIWLSSSGDALVHLNPIPSIEGVTKISVQYYGDAEYNVAWVYFPLTNPPISNSGGSGGSSGSGGGSSGSNGQATPTVGGTATAQPTGTVEATPTASGASGLLGPTSSSPGTGVGLVQVIILVLLILLGLGAAAGAALYLTRRAKRARLAASQASPTPPVSSPASSYQDTIPFTRDDR